MWTPNWRPIYGPPRSMGAPVGTAKIPGPRGSLTESRHDLALGAALGRVGSMASLRERPPVSLVFFGISSPFDTGVLESQVFCRTSRKYSSRCELGSDFGRARPSAQTILSLQGTCCPFLSLVSFGIWAILLLAQHDDRIFPSALARGGFRVKGSRGASRTSPLPGPSAGAPAASDCLQRCKAMDLTSSFSLVTNSESPVSNSVLLLKEDPSGKPPREHCRTRPPWGAWLSAPQPPQSRQELGPTSPSPPPPPLAVGAHRRSPPAGSTSKETKNKDKSAEQVLPREGPSTIRRNKKHF